MLAAACAVGVGCCFAAPIGGRVPPARTSHPCSRVLAERPAGPCSKHPSLPGGGTGTCPSGASWHGRGSAARRGARGAEEEGRRGAVLPEV